MRLTDLDPQLLRLEHHTDTWTRVLGDPRTWKPGDSTEQVTGEREYYVPVATIAEADGLMFSCPLCWRNRGSGAGVHKVLCWFVGRVADNVSPGPGRWTCGGSGYGDLTLGPGPSGMSSVKLEDGCCWHGHITNGEATFD